VLKTECFGPELAPPLLLFEQPATRVSPDQSRRHPAEANIVHFGQSTVRRKCFLESTELVKIPPETEQGAGPNRRIGRFCELVEHVDGCGAVLPTELEILPGREGCGSSFGQRLDDREIRHPLAWRRLDLPLSKRHGHRFVGPRSAAGGDALLGHGDRALESGHDEVGAALDPLPDLLLFEGAVLFQETPPEPQERGQRHHGDANDQRDEAP